MAFEIQAHRGNDELTLSRLLAAAPSSIELDVGLANGELVVAHDTDLGDATGLELAAVLAASRGTRVVVEAKCFPPATPPPRAFAQALQPLLGEIALCSFNERVLVEAQRLRPELETTFLFERRLRLETSAATIGPRRDLVSTDLVDSAHARGLRVVPWTVNDPEEMAALIELGVDGLVTDDPALAHAVLRGQRSEAVA